METKIVFVVCLHLLCLKHAFAQCMPATIMPESANPMAMPNGMPGQFTSQLAMQTPFPPSPSFSIFSDDLLVDGLISVTGSMPFLSTVTVGGTLPANGQGNVLYSCGDGQIGIYNEMPIRESEIAAVRSMPGTAVVL